MSTPRLVLASLFLCSAMAGVASAHDFWIAPSKFRLSKGDTVSIALRYGVEYNGEVAARDELRIVKFVTVGPDGESTIPGNDRTDPAGTVTPTKDGIWIAAYRNKRRSIELEPEKFLEYLKEEGLEHVIKAREEATLTETVGREVYSRCAKAILKVGEGSAEGHDRVVGLRMEIVPETNPYAVTSGAAMTFRVILDDKPLVNGLVVARSRNEPAHAVSARSDAGGRVQLTLDREGEWMVKCTHMVVAPPETGMDWESLWASVTFDLDAAKPVVPTEAK